MSLLTSLAGALRPSALPSAGAALSLAGESVAHRAELAALELDEAREHTTVSILLSVAAVAFIQLAGFAVTLLVASLVWDSPDRGWWLGGLAVIYLAAAVSTVWILRLRLRAWEPLASTRQQLKDDYQCLSSLLKSHQT